MNSDIYIWARFLLDDEGKVAVGGVEAYAMALGQSLASTERKVKLLTPFNGEFAEKNELIEVVSLASWESGQISGQDLESSIHIYTDIHNGPEYLYPNSIGIQHGILWDKPIERFKNVPSIFKPVINFWRNYSRVSVTSRFKHLVCVDLTFPNNVACVKGKVDWNRFHYIPNFAPLGARPENFDSKIERIVFSRRFVEHRGTEIFIKAVENILKDGWKGEVHFVGGGPLKNKVEQLMKIWPTEVKLYRLPFEERLNAFTQHSICVVPSLSTEGTSLSCIEGWSKGALVMSTGVGGLGNLVQDRVSGLLFSPTEKGLESALRMAIENKVDVKGIRQRGWDTFECGFTQDIWQEKWLDVIKQFDVER